MAPVSAPSLLADDMMAIKARIVDAIRKRENPRAKEMSVVVTLPQFIPYDDESSHRKKIIDGVKDAIEGDGTYRLKYKRGSIKEPDAYIVQRDKPLPVKRRELGYV